MKHMKLLAVILGLVMAGVDAWAVETLDPAVATPGRTGVCVTEMDGGERVEIPLTVLGTVGSGRPDGEIVLVRLDHPHGHHMSSFPNGPVVRPAARRSLFPIPLYPANRGVSSDCPSDFRERPAYLGGLNAATLLHGPQSPTLSFARTFQ